MNNWSDIFSFSTSWNVSRHINGAKMVNEIINMGFKKIELNYKVTQKMLDEILPMVEKGIVNVTSVHNVCPMTENPDHSPDSIFLADTDRVKRKEAIVVTEKTVDIANLFGASAVVLHVGQIPVPKEYDNILKILFVQGKKDTDEYKKIKDEFIDYKKSVGPEYVELVCQSLEEICNYIEKNNYQIVLGVENRFRCHQIPDFIEAQFILEKLKGLPVYFWYDIGHGIVQGALGIVNNPEGAYNLSDRTFGLHIHDVVDFRDHFCPYANGEEYDKYVDIIDKAHLKTFEIGSMETDNNIIKSANYLYGKLKESYPSCY